MRFTITPQITAARMSGRSALSRTGLSLPLSLRARAVQGQRSTNKAGLSSTVTGSSTTEKTWKDRYLEQVKEQAKKDCAAGILMGDDYKALEKETMSKYVSSTSSAAQTQFLRESVEAYTTAWYEAKAAQSSGTTSGLSGFDKKV